MAVENNYRILRILAVFGQPAAWFSIRSPTVQAGEPCESHIEQVIFSSNETHGCEFDLSNVYFV